MSRVFIARLMDSRCQVMEALLVYDSTFGNTERIALEIAEGLRDTYAVSLEPGELDRARTCARDLAMQSSVR